MVVLVNSPHRADSAILRTGSRLDVNEALTGLRPALALMAAGGVEVEIDLNACRSAIELETDAFARIIMDLIDRMRSNMPGDGRLRIGTEDGPRGFLEIELHDIGTDSLREDLESMFGQDTLPDQGLARPDLSGAFRLVRDAGGTIVCETGPGWGNCLRVLLPTLPDTTVH